MLNIIKSDLIKLKWLVWLKLLFFLTIIFFSIVYLFLFSTLIDWSFNNLKTLEFVWNILSDNIRADVVVLMQFLNMCLILIFSIVTDYIFWIDRNKNIILFTKNIRAKYLWSKYFIILIYILLTLLSINLIVSWTLFVIYSIPLDLIITILQELLFKSLLLFIIIIPTILIFSFLNVIWIRSLIIWWIILFYFFINLMFNLSSNEKLGKYFSFVSQYTFIWNYDSYLKEIINNEDYYNEYKIDKKFIGKELQEKYNANTKKLDQIKILASLLWEQYKENASWRDGINSSLELNNKKFWNNDQILPNTSILYLEKRDEFLNKYWYNFHQILSQVNSKDLGHKYLNETIKITFSKDFESLAFNLNWEKQSIYNDNKINSFIEYLKIFNINYTNTEINVPKALILLFNDPYFNIEDYNNVVIEEIEKNISIVNIQFEKELSSIDEKDIKTRYVKLYESLWWYEKYLIDLEWNQKDLNNKVNVEYKLLYTNYKEVLWYFIWFNNRFYSLLITFIIIGLLGSIIMRKKQVYN